MKKIILLLILSLLFIPQVFAADNVAIEKVELVTKSENTIINGDPKFKGLEMNYDISFQKVGDSVKYKIIVKNNTNKDYKISTDTAFSKSDCIKYDYEVAKELKANESVELYLTITYNKELSKDKFKDGKYQESNTAVVKLSNDEVNPNTSSYKTMFIIFGIYIILLSGFLIMQSKNNKYVKITSLVIMIGISSIPVIAKAIEELKIVSNIKVEVVNTSSASQKTYKVLYKYHRYDVLYSQEELENSPFTMDNCEPVYGTNSTSNSPIAYTCDKVVIEEDPQQYAAGETVAMSTKRHNFLQWFTQSEEQICNNPNDIVTCEYLDVKTFDFSNWSYDKYEITSEGYTYSEDDGEIMNFQRGTGFINDFWESAGHIVTTGQVTFTMPNHDVIFVEPNNDLN